MLEICFFDIWIRIQCHLHLLDHDFSPLELRIFKGSLNYIVWKLIRQKVREEYLLVAVLPLWILHWQVDDFIQNCHQLLGLIRMSRFYFLNHFYAVFYQFAAISFKRHSRCISLDKEENLILPLVLTVFKHRTEHKDSILIFAQIVVIFDDRLSRGQNKCRMTFLKHPLHDSAAVLMHTEINDGYIDLIHKRYHRFWSRLLAHLRNYLLNHMISIEVKACILNRFSVKKLLDHFFFLAKCQNLKTGLHNSASMFMRWIFEDFAFDPFINYVRIFLW